MNRSRDASLEVAAALPIGIAILASVAPLLILLADVLPPGLPIEVGRGFAVALASIVALLITVSLAALLVRFGARAFWRAPLVAPLGAFLAIEIVAAASRLSPQASSLAIASQFAATLIFVAAYWTLADERLRRIFVAAFLASGTAASLFAIALVLSKHPPSAFAYLHGRAAGTFLQPNEFAGYLLFLIPLGLAQLRAPRALARLGLAAAAAGAAGLALSFSRAGGLGLLVGLPVLAARFGYRTLVAYLVSAAVIAGVIVATPAARNVAHDPSENPSRIVVWRGAARIAQRFPLTGIGPAAFARVYPRYKMPYAVANEVHAHDLPLNVLVEEGIAGLVIFAWLVMACVVEARRTGAAIGRDDSERSLLFAALAAAFLGSAAQNVIDDVTSFVLILWWPMMGLMLSLAPRATRAIGAPRGGAPAPAFLAVVAITAASIVGCSRAGTPAAISSTSPGPQSNAPNIASVTAHGAPGKPITTSYIVNSHPVYVLRAASVTYLPSRSQGTFSDNRLIFYKGTAPRLTVTAPSAILNLKTYDVVMRGGVQAVSASGDVLKADQIEYVGTQHQLLASGNVVAIDAAGTQISGDHAIADLDLQEVKIFGHITMSGGR